MTQKMTPTEKRYTREVGEIFQYNTRYWYGWEESEKENYVVTVMVAGVTKDNYNGMYYYKLMKIGGEGDNIPYFNLDSVQCSMFILPSRSRKVGDVGACAPAAPVCANTVPQEVA
jgi:hypothetical protein